MKEKDIIDAYCIIRKTNMNIPDDVLDFIKESSIIRLRKMCTHEPISLSGRYTNCKHCNMVLQLQP